MKRVLTEKARDFDTEIHLFTVPILKFKNPIKQQINQITIGKRIAEELSLKPVNADQGYLTFDPDYLIQPSLLRLLKQQASEGTVRHLFVRNINLLSKNPFFCSMIIHWFIKQGTKIYDEKGLVTKENINVAAVFGSLVFLEDYESFIELIQA